MAVIDHKPSSTANAVPGPSTSSSTQQYPQDQAHETDPFLSRGPPPAYDGSTSTSARTQQQQQQQQQRVRPPKKRTTNPLFGLLNRRAADDLLTTDDDDDEDEDQRAIDESTYEGRRQARIRRQELAQRRRLTRRVRQVRGCCRRCCVLFIWTVLGGGVIVGLTFLVLWILREKSDRERGQHVRLLDQW
ncbi:unnamed protein product [Tilletia laevis]|uniref:Uncharacterized protein n=2 Tax=Tilletia TaxID=13289 RepID=A0A177VEZ7_9BASI|nr:hypothetical protein CF336_g6564 [Tilletia laevis]KAE8252962.1 hypothetical protein A4X03_0g6027 [Tilletia caries]KAE8191760.1 hypothetical protein CF335_g6000 [Tilletia laevis]CAD6893282.1 unnamed protein product [Tilletia caries]CAD6909601.1 unnamed protein product [Tilletia caries]